MQRQDLAVHHNRPLELAKPWCAGITHWAHWWGQAFNQMMKACDECARQRDEDGTGKPCTVGEAVAGASVFELCLPSAVAQAPCPGKPGTRHSCFKALPVGVKRSTETKLVTMCRTWWVWHYLKQMSLVLVSGGWVGKQHRDWAQQAWPSPVEVDLYRWSLHQNVHLGQLFRNWDESHYQC